MSDPTKVQRCGSLRHIPDIPAPEFKNWVFDDYGTMVYQTMDADSTAMLHRVCDVRGWGHFSTRYGDEKGREPQDALARLFQTFGGATVSTPTLTQPIFSRQWAMSSRDTFSIRPIGEFVKKYMAQATVSCDPFARNCTWATYTNDLNPNTSAQHHMDASDYLHWLAASGVRCDLVILDPPYSPRQISECYKEAGIKVEMQHTQNSRLYNRVKSAAAQVLSKDGIVLSFGWNSSGMGKKHGFEIIEIMLVAHGGAKNDTICIAEKRAPEVQS